MKALNVVATVILLTLAITVCSVRAVPADVISDSTVVTQSTDKEKLFDHFEKSLVYGFTSDVTGVVESSIFNSVNYKAAYPDFSSAKVEEELNRLALTGENHSLRYKAYLALSYYRHPGQFDSPEVLLSIIDTRHQNGIFFYLQEKVQSEQFTSNQ